MDIWKYEQTDWPTEWEALIFGLADRERRRPLWAVSVRGQVFTGFKTRREARAYGKHIEAEGADHLPPSVADLARLPEALAEVYRTVSRGSGYVYDPERLGWVKSIGDTIITGFEDDQTYRSAGAAAREALEPEVASLLEMLEEHMAAILAGVRSGTAPRDASPEKPPRVSRP